MAEKYQRPDHIRVVNVVCVEYGNNDEPWYGFILMSEKLLSKQKKC